MRKENSKTSVEEPKELPSGALRCGGLPIITWAGKTPMMTIFDWDDIDHSLVGLKLTDMAEEMRKLISEDEARIRLENRHNANRAAVPTLILRMKEQRADEWAQKRMTSTAMSGGSRADRSRPVLFVRFLHSLLSRCSALERKQSHRT